MPSYDAVLFDNDGVLVEPPARETQAAAVRRAFEAVGVGNPDERHVDAIVDGVTVDGLRDIASAYGVDPAALWDARERHDEDSQLEQFRAGERDRYPDVTALRDLDRPCGVVSNNHHTTVEFVLDYFDLGARFDTYYGREMTVESLRLKKPDTHYLDRALGDVGAVPEATLYVGDSESDVVAAERAGMDSVFVRREAWADVTLDATPTHEVSSLHDVVSLLAR
jgi:HAD superfamily hydrolase (TIGR01549 family)